MAFSPQGLSKPNSRLSVCVKHEQVRVALCIRDALKLIEAHVDVPIWGIETRRFQECVDDKYFKLFFLFGKWRISIFDLSTLKVSYFMLSW